MQDAENTPVHTPIPIVRATAAIGLISGALVIGWGIVLIIGAFFQRTASFATVTKGFAFFLLVAFVFTVASVLLDDYHQSQEKRSEARRRELKLVAERARRDETQMANA
jgi:uncharacterized protein YlxW (UPF0749 family)